MATGRNPGPIGDIAPVEDARPAASDDDKAKVAEAEAAAAAAAIQTAADQRFVQYVVAVKEAGKVVSRPSGGQVIDPSAAGRVGVSSASAIYRPQDWAANGLTGDTVVWDSEHNWRVPASKFSAEQLHHLLVEDRRHNGVRFELVDGNGQTVDN